MEGIYCSITSQASLGWTVHSLDRRKVSDSTTTTTTTISFRCRNPLFDAMQSHWLPIGQDICPSKVCVAADHSDSVPDSSRYIGNRGYHPLEERKECKRSKNTKLTPAVTAKTIVESNSSALLVFPGKVHHEPHDDISWGEYQYIIDDQGDIYFRIPGGASVLQCPDAINPVNILIGMDIPMHGNRTRAVKQKIMPRAEDMTLYEYYFELLGLKVSDTPRDWKPSKRSHLVHPMYFARCLTKAINTDYKSLDRPSNGLSIMGCLRPATMDEISCVTEIIDDEDTTGFYEELKDQLYVAPASYVGNLVQNDLPDQMDLSIKSRNSSYSVASSFSDEIRRFEEQEDQQEEEEDQASLADPFLDYEILNYEFSNTSSRMLYKLEIITIELFSAYGVQCLIGLREFEKARPDVLGHDAEVIIRDLTEKGLKLNAGLKALCRKKGLNVEGANLVGVDSLGMDVRVFSGLEAQTLRFPFKVQVDSVSAAEKSIKQMLFPRSQRKKLKKPATSDEFCDPPNSS